MSKIPYCLPHFTDKEIAAVSDLLENPSCLLTEKYTKLCRQHLTYFYQRQVLPTHSCTAALEMIALLLNIQPGDEVIVPSYTFVSTANAFALFGAKLVFVDMQEDTLNLDPTLLASHITPRTKAIVVMHYAAVACDMDQILAIANEYHVPVIEDAAQCIGAKYNGKLLGQLGTLNALSFHSTKNITSGLGGALILNDDSFLPRAKIIWQKGTNREAFLEGNVDKYTWQDLGSSYMINELGAALLAAQLERLEQINRTRLNIWQNYHVALAEAEKKYGYRRPVIPEGCEHNGHIYYLIAPNESVAVDLRKFLAEQGIVAPFHYIPLHMTPAGQKYAKQSKSLPVCEGIYQRVIRLPIWEGLEGHLPFIIDTLYKKMTRLLATRGEQP